MNISISCNTIKQYTQEIINKLNERGCCVLPIQEGSKHYMYVVHNNHSIKILLDIRVCSKNYFTLARVKDSHKRKMLEWQISNNGTAWFCIISPTGQSKFIIAYKILQLCNTKIPKLTPKVIETIGIDFDNFVDKYKKE